MLSLKIATFLALLCAAAIAQDEDLNDNLIPNESNDAIIEERKFYRPLLFHPHLHPIHKPHPTETEETSIEARFDKNTETLEEVQEKTDSVEEDQVKEKTGSVEDGQVEEETDAIENYQNQVKEETGQIEDDQVQEDQVEEESINEEDLEKTLRKSYTVPCDFLNTPSYSCYTCYTYLVCKASGGKVKSCADPNALYCNNGECSATPSIECSQNSSAVFY